MRTKSLLMAVAMATLPLPVSAAEEAHADHPTIFHAFKLETDIGDNREGTIASWDFDGWVGSDYNKLWLKSEGEHVEGDTHEAEFWAMYSRNVAEFWDAQVGLRHDTQPRSTSYVVVGFNGLAPYFFETEAHLFISDDGDVSARIRQENDLLLTQRLVLQPYGEINLFAQDVPELDTGAGLATGEIGLQTRYEITRKFAPYIDLRYERKFGETSSIARSEGEHRDDFIASAGLWLMF
jgi:copper resistance protein B